MWTLMEFLQTSHARHINKQEQVRGQILIRLSLMLNGFSCSFTSISFRTKWNVKYVRFLNIHDRYHQLVIKKQIHTVNVKKKVSCGKIRNYFLTNCICIDRVSSAFVSFPLSSVSQQTKIKIQQTSNFN